MGLEIKYQDAPQVAASMRAVMEDLDPAALWVVYPGCSANRVASNVKVAPVRDLGLTWNHEVLPRTRWLTVPAPSSSAGSRR